MWEQLESVSPDIRSVWRAVVEAPGLYSITGSEFWGISFARQGDGSLRAELDGPSLTARTVVSIRGESYWGVELAAHVLVPGVDKSAILGATVELPIKGGAVQLGDLWVPIPGWSEIENFVARLIELGALVTDPHVRRALQGDDGGYSPRSWQRRFRRVTGITRKQIAQLERARHAFLLLQHGIPAAEAALLAGYADQSHLTRSLKLVRDETPARILARVRAA